MGGRFQLAWFAMLAAGGCYQGLDGAPPEALASATDSGVAESGDAGSTGAETQGANDDDPDVLIDEDGESFDVESTCVDTLANERVLSVSPEGDLWLHDPDDVAVRVLEPSGTAHELALPWPVEFARAWGRDRAAVIAMDTLWVWDVDTAEPIAWPATLPAPWRFCGDPASDGDGLVLAGDVFSRDLGQWWRWNLPGGGGGPQSVLAASAGSCWGASDRAWLREGDAVWSVESDWVGAQPELEPSSGIAADDAFGVASIVAGDVVFGDEDFTRARFSAGGATALTAGPGNLWIAAGEGLYRMRDGEFAQARSGGEAIHADAIYGDGAGGVWTVDDAQACYRSAGAHVRVTGLRPNERRRVPELSASFEAAGMAQLEITIDGEAVPAALGDDGVWTIDATLDEGWHEVIADAQTDNGDVRRTLNFAVEQLVPATWSADVEPLFAQHCSGAECHGPGPSDDRPDLSQYDTWVDLAETVRDRVGQTSDMPPPGAGDGSWGVDEILTVLGWLDAGLPTEG